MKVMSFSFPGIPAKFLVVIITTLSLLAGCGEEDPVVEATDDAPVVENFGIAYLKRPAASFFTDTQVATNFPPELDDNDPTVGVTPGDVYIRDLSTINAEETNITSSITAPIPGVKSAGDVSDLEVSYDGSILVFSMHEGMYEGRMDDEQPKWNIWVYDMNAPQGSRLQRVIQSDNEAFKGNDVDPHFLPDGRIVFSSDRRDRSRSMNLDLYGDEYITVNERNAIGSGATAYALHVMDITGSRIKQISFNQSNDFDPTVLDNGKILFSRWDGVGPRNAISLYTVNPDGTELDIYYGAHSHAFIDNSDPQNPVTVQMQYAETRQLPGGGLLGMHLPFTGTQGGGEMISIDHANFVEFDQKRFTSPTLSTEGHVSATNNEINPFAGVSLYGRYMTPYPIYEAGNADRVLVAWNPCRLTDDPTQPLAEVCDEDNINDDNTLVPPYQIADSLYSIWILDLSDNDKKMVVNPELGLAIVNPVAMINRPIAERPPVLTDKTVDNGQVDPDLFARSVGIINIKSVYDTVGTVPMVDMPLRPRGANTLLTTETIPTTTVEMDTVTGALVTDPSDPTIVPVSRTVADIETIRDPALTTADQRVARFIRINKAVPKIPGPNNEINGDDFGRSAGYEMREILGYTQVEPDGSVYMEVPADVPFTISILDAKGRSLMSHTNWIQLQRGEVRVCNGCHSPVDGQQSINPGAPFDGPFPNTGNTILAVEGETMAETRARLDCLAGCTYPQLKRDIIYDDVWTDPLVRTPDASYTYSYSTLITPSPVSNVGACDDVNWPWEGGFCRIAINFPEHIQPILDARCIACHNDDDPNAIPPGNLVLEAQIDPVNSPRLQAYRDAATDTDRLASYEFLFVSRPQMEPDPAGGRRFVVVERNAAGEPVIDLDGDGIRETVVGETDIGNLEFAGVRPSLASQGVASARRSRVVEVLTGDTLFPGGPIATPSQDHTAILTEGELRMIIEWLDNGTQNYNGLNAALIN